MDSNIQRVFSILLSVIIFFLFPLYVTFEKKDDISYALSLRMTYNFVNNVKDKGYISYDMYNDFVNELGVTSNLYDIKLEHKRKKYEPAIFSYDDLYNQILGKFDYITYKNELSKGEINQNGKTYKNLVLGYDVIEEIYNEKQILESLNYKKEDENIEVRNVWCY